MNNIYQDDEFEQFLQNSVKQHRIYPSDHIWKNIRTQIHGYRAWPALTFISLFIITALTLSTLLNNHPDTHLASIVAFTNAQQSAAGNFEKGTTVTAVERNKRYFEQTAPDQITAQTFADIQPDVQDEFNYIATPMRDVTATTVRSPASDLSSEKNTRKDLTHMMRQEDRASITILPSDNYIGTDAVATTTAEQANATEEAVKESTIAKTENKKTDTHATADDFLKEFSFIAGAPRVNRNSKFGFQFYVTPSTSYRRLSDAKVKEVIQPAVAAAQNIPMSLNNSTDVNDVVRHRPAMGLELGFGVLYNITNKLKFKTGVQMNVRQYYIETFQSLTNDLTSISLINYRGIETISFYSQYNNNTGYKKTQLDNKIYQLAVPLGVQWEVFQGKHIGMNAEVSVQPTLTLNTHTYLLSTDYKHYTDGNDLIRKWNINTSMGFNITYKAGSLLYTVGPQVRYQHMPTFSNLYPIKEYLMDYGIRLGITKQLK